MAAYYPPTNFFQNINFNNDFYAIPNNNQGISLSYANTHYLFSTGVATSTAISTLFSGSVGIGTIGGNAGTLNALNINAINSLQINGTDILSTITNNLIPYDKIVDRETAITGLSNALQENINTANNNITSINNNITNNYYDKNTIDNSLALKQNNLTFQSPLTNIANTVSIDLSLYDKITDRNTAILNLSNIYVSSNVITGYLAPYDLITDRQAAINTVNNSIGNINNTLNTCLKTTDIQSGDIGLYSAPGGSFLNIVFNATHFKDVAVFGVNRQFNLNDVYANLPTTKNDVISWDAPLNYNTSTKRASIDLSNYYIKSEITNIISNTSNYASNISNVIIRNTSNYASNISNVLLTNYNSLNTNTNTNISNYASNISNVLLTNYNSLNTNTNTNISNYASNISNVLLINYNSLNTNTNTNISNYASNISNILKANIDTNNTAINISIGNTSNYATNISNIIIANNSNFTLGTSNNLTNLINSNLDICNAWTKSNNYIYNTNLGKVGIGINTPTGLLELYKNTSSSIAQFKFGHEERWSINHMFSLAFMRFMTAYTLTNEIAHFGYVDSYDNPLLRTTVLKITKDEMEMDGDLYLNKMNLSSSVGVYLSGKSNEISSLFSSKPPFAAYFAEDFTGSTIPNYLKNGRDATTTGTITQTTAEGNGVNTPITYITGTSTSTISFAAGSIPTTFTILSFTRYNGGTRQRILTSKTTGDWCHGHRNNNRGAVRYVIDRAIYSYISQIDNWACVIGKNVGSTGSILLNGVDNSLNQNGTGGFTLGINNGAYPAEYGDWAFNCVIIWDTALTNAEMVLLNGMINTYKSTGKSLKQYFNDDCIMENREYTTNSSRELLLLKSNNLNSSFGTDRIRLKATNILFDTFSTATTDKTETTKMIINSSGNIGVGIINPLQKLHIDAGCLFITNNVSNPGTNASVSLWNQAFVGPTISGFQFVVQTNGTIERFRIDNNGLITTTGSIDCGGGIALTGADAFYNIGGVDATNRTNTYINFKMAGATNDWCYLRQIGGPETIKLTLDFHDDANDARFCIRSVHSAASPADVIKEVFTVDNGNISYTGYTTCGTDLWNRSSDGVYRTYYGANNISYYCCGGNDAIGHIFMNNSYGNAFHIYNNGDVKCFGGLTAGNTNITGSIQCSGNLQTGNTIAIKGTSEGDLATLYLATPYTTNSAYKCAIIAQGLNTYSRSKLHFCLNNVGDNTYPTQNASLANSRMSIDYDGNLTTTGNITCLLYSVDYVGYDDVGVLDVSGINQNNSKILRQIWNSFTAFHRCFIDDELFNIDNPQDFKDIYMGRIVVSTGTIKTHSSKTKTDGDTEWEIKTGKEAIIIEDAHPTIKLSRKKKDKRVLGVLGLNTRNNSHPERLIVNSIGEGGIWVCNSNGNIENGDYITSSDYLGYGEKQDDDLLHNYTVAKTTMDCDFQLESPLYQCLELNEGLRIAFIACTYHCG